MLPGIRFIFVTVILSASVLIFGLGAAALLRVSHEEFATLPTLRMARGPTPVPAHSGRDEHTNAGHATDRDAGT